jgi:hypothetical protein
MVQDLDQRGPTDFDERSHCSLERFTVFEGPDPTDITDIGPSLACKEAVDAALELPLTSKSFYFLSELKPALGDNFEKLPCFLWAVKDTELGRGTLVIDVECVLSEPLWLPTRFTLAGTGIDGDGRLQFKGLAKGASAIRLQPQARNVTIRDLSIGNKNEGHNVGIDVSRADLLYIRDTIVSGFYAGIYGSRPGLFAMGVFIERCQLLNNFGIVMHRNGYHWRIQDTVLSQCKCWGLRIFGKADDPVPNTSTEEVWGNHVMVTGCLFEGCDIGGASLASDSAVLMSNRFENNGGNGGVGIQALSSSTRTRLATNLLSANTIQVHAGADPPLLWGNIGP